MTTARGHLTQKQKAVLMIQQDGKCAECGARLIAGLFDWDHIQDLQHEGDNKLDNFRAICTKPCHQQKTRKGIQARAKVERIAVGGRERKGPPMAGSRSSKWKRHLDGTISER